MATLYDPTQVSMTFDGETVVGFADGTMISASFNEDRHDLYTGSQGEDTFTVNADDSGTIEVTLKHNSPSINTMYQAYRRNEIVNVSIFDDNATSTEGVGGNECVVADMGDMSRSDDVSDQTITLLVANLQQVYSGNNY